MVVVLGNSENVELGMFWVTGMDRTFEDTGIGGGSGYGLLGEEYCVPDWSRDL